MPPPARGPRKASPKRIQITQKQQQALQLRLSGATFDEIAPQLGYADRSGPYKAVRAALKETLREDAEELREVELARMDRLQLGLWSRALQGDPQAIDRVLRIMERRAKLMGLDAPQRTELTGAEGGPIKIDDARAVLAARLDAIAEHRAKKKGAGGA